MRHEVDCFLIKKHSNTFIYQTVDIFDTKSTPESSNFDEVSYYCGVNATDYFYFGRMFMTKKLRTLKE